MSSNKNVQLLLTDSVESLGIVGDVVTVRHGYARNYLLPMGLATQPTEGNVKRLQAKRAQVQKQLSERRARQEATLQKLVNHELTLQRSANEEGILFGSVTQRDIADGLRAEGFEIAERDIRIGIPIKKLDSYTIPLQLADDLKTTLKLWVVSDKPAGELVSSGTASPTGAQGSGGETSPKG